MNSGSRNVPSTLSKNTQPSIRIRLALLMGLSIMVGCAGNQLVLPDQDSTLPQNAMQRTQAEAVQPGSQTPYKTPFPIEQDSGQALAGQTHPNAVNPQGYQANPVHPSGFPVQMASFQEPAAQTPPQPNGVGPMLDAQPMTSAASIPAQANDWPAAERQVPPNVHPSHPQAFPNSRIPNQTQPNGHFSNHNPPMTTGQFTDEPFIHEMGQPLPRTPARLDMAPAQDVYVFPSHAQNQAFAEHQGYEGIPSQASFQSSSPQSGRQYGVNVVGSEFRSPQPTATEIMILLKDENKKLREKIAAMDGDIRGLKDIIKTERVAREHVDGELKVSQSQNQKLLEMVAKLQVQVENLNAEKITIKQQADEALKQIETNLDTVLLNSMSKAPQRNSLRQGN